MKDHYAALHILPAATADEIKKAFRRLALQYHPDKNKEPLAHTRFTEVREAYEMLKDPVKRAAYNYKLYSSQSVHTRKAAAQSSADILHESWELARIVSGLDPFRVDHDIISFRVRDIISEWNVGILLQEENSSIRIQAVQNIINALQLLPLPLAIDCLRPLQPLVEAYPEIKTEINRFFSNAKWQFYWDRYKVYIALTIAAAACLLILLSVSN